MKCVCCNSSAVLKVLYVGFPMRLCLDCNTGQGFWSFIPLWFGFNGMFFVYHTGYLIALWHFLIGVHE